MHSVWICRAPPEWQVPDSENALLLVEPARPIRFGHQEYFVRAGDLADAIRNAGGTVPRSIETASSDEVVPLPLSACVLVSERMFKKG